MAASPDPNRSAFLRFLADAADSGMDAKKIQKALALFERRPSHPPLVPTPSPVVFSGEEISTLKRMKRSPLPYIQWRPKKLAGMGASARVMLYQDTLAADGRKVKRNVPYPLGKVTIEEAERMRLEIVERQNKRKVPVSIVTVQQFIEQRYLPERVANLSKGSRDTYECILRLHIIQAYGNKQLRDLDASDLQTLIDLKATKYSRETVKHIKAYASGFLSYAQALKLIDTNPAFLVRLPRQYGTKERVRVTPKEVEANNLIEVLADPRFSPCFEMMGLSCCTSIHHSELTALRWKRVNLTDELCRVDDKDLPGHSVSVMESFYGGEFGPPKNRKRVRIEAIPPEVVEALAALKARSKFTGPDDVVFCDEEGRPLNRHHTRHLLVSACKKAGVPQLGWHGFRRYFATQSKWKGMDQDDRERSLGHAAANMTLHYTAEDLDRRRPAVAAIADGLFAAQKKPAITKP